MTANRNNMAAMFGSHNIIYLWKIEKGTSHSTYFLMLQIIGRWFVMILRHIHKPFSQTQISVWNYLKNTFMNVDDFIWLFWTKSTIFTVYWIWSYIIDKLGVKLRKTSYSIFSATVQRRTVFLESASTCGLCAIWGRTRSCKINFCMHGHKRSKLGISSFFYNHFIPK